MEAYGRERSERLRGEANGGKKMHKNVNSCLQSEGF
jgi:hypothetical protein